MPVIGNLSRSESRAEPNAVRAGNVSVAPYSFNFYNSSAKILPLLYFKGCRRQPGVIRIPLFRCSDGNVVCWFGHTVYYLQGEFPGRASQVDTGCSAHCYAWSLFLWHYCAIMPNGISGVSLDLYEPCGGAVIRGDGKEGSTLGRGTTVHWFEQERRNRLKTSMRMCPSSSQQRQLGKESINALKQICDACKLQSIVQTTRYT